MNAIKIYIAVLPAHPHIAVLHAKSTPVKLGKHSDGQLGFSSEVQSFACSAKKQAG